MEWEIEAMKMVPVIRGAALVGAAATGARLRLEALPEAVGAAFQDVPVERN